jgi:hypothetical protein
MRSLVCGHSFIKRYRQNLLRLHHNIHASTGSDFHPAYGLTGQENIFVEGQGGLCTNQIDLNYIRHHVATLYPELLVLEIGTNDLVNNVLPRELARKVIAFCEELLTTTSVRSIVLCKIVQRRKTRDCPRAEFDHHRAIYNRLIQEFARRNQRVFTYKHERSILVNLHRRISHDEIHVTSTRGQRLYHFSIRKAIIIGLQRLLRL